MLVFVAAKGTADEVAAAINASPDCLAAAADCRRLLAAVRDARDEVAAIAAGLVGEAAVAGSGGSSSKASGSAWAEAAAAIHGDKVQHERSRVIARFRSGATPVVVGTDLVARGLDIEGIAAVISFDAPSSADTHVHRIGRTGRLGRDGIAHRGLAITMLTDEVRDAARSCGRRDPVLARGCERLCMRCTRRTHSLRGTWCGTCSGMARLPRPICCS